jgi:hypothetical protein
MKQAGLEGECQFPLQDDLPDYVADFALFCKEGRIAVTISETPRRTEQLGESAEVVANYLALAGRWRLVFTSAAEMEQDPTACASRLAVLVDEAGGLEGPPNEESLYA